MILSAILKIRDEHISVNFVEEGSYFHEPDCDANYKEIKEDLMTKRYRCVYTTSSSTEKLEYWIRVD